MTKINLKMFWRADTIIVLVCVFLPLGASTQECQKNSYLPQGLSCKLDIFIRSEGQSDTNLSAPLGSSFLIVNGRDYSRKSRGINLAVFDLMTGRYMSGEVFDVKESAAQGTKLRDFLQLLPNKVIILMAVQGTGNANNNLNDAISVMSDIGANNTALLVNESFGAIFYKGPGSQPWIKESKNTAGNGPSFLTASIPVPYGYIPEESLRTPFFNIAGLMFGGHCIQSSSNHNATTVCDKALDGSVSSEWVTKSEGVGAWITIGFASAYKINKIRILQRTFSGAQSKELRIDFSDCSTFAVSLTRDKGDFEEFKFSPRIVSWVKVTVTSTHTASSNGFKEIQFYYDQYQSDYVCDQVNVSTGSTSKAYRLLASSIALQILSQKPVLILSTTSSSSGPRYEIVLDDPDNSNTTYVKRSHDGSAIKQVAVSIARSSRVISASTSVHVWLDWKAGRVIVGMGENVILYYRDEQPLNVKYMFLQSPSSNAIYKLCGRKEYIYRSASKYWPLDKEMDINGCTRGTLHGPYETKEAQGNTEGFSFVATRFDGKSNWGDLGDFRDSCISDIDSCYNGLTVTVRINRQGSGERFVVSSGGQHTRGFAIYLLNSTTLRVELRDSDKRWLVDKSHVASGHLLMGFSWSRNHGLTVVSGTASSTSEERNSIGEMLSSPVDESSHLTLGRPNNQFAKYFEGSIDNLAIFEYSMTSNSLTALLKSTGMSGYSDSCYKDTSVSSSFLYYPGDIDPEMLSHSVCREHCGNAYYTKAVIYDGSFCMCVNVTSSFVSVGNDMCVVPCTGMAEKKCGGLDSNVHVLDAIRSTTSLVCNIPTKQEALSPFTASLQISKPFYNLKYNYLEVGDGSVNENQYSPFKHVFVAVQNFTTTPKAVLKNNETGQRLVVECPNSVKSFLPVKGVSFTCPAYVPTNMEFKCDISFTQGHDVDVQVKWSDFDLATKLRLPDSELVSLGLEYTAREPPVNRTSPGMYVLPYTIKNHQGTFVGFYVDVISEGYLAIKCLKVVCDDSSQRFCPSQRSCISQHIICEPESVNCSGGSALAMSSGSCLPNNAGSLNIPTVSSSNFNYKSMSDYVAWINSGQRSLVTLNNTVDISDCDFFGLAIPSHASAAVIATSYAIQSTLFYSPSAVSAASANNDTFVGLHSPSQPNGPQVVDNVPKFKSKVVPHLKMPAVHTYLMAGIYEAKAEFSSVGGSTTNIIHAQDVVTNISLISVPAYQTQKASNFSLSPHLGTNVTYSWVFNDTTIITSTPWVIDTCETSGIHSVAVLARNNVSVSYSVCEYECQDEISGLEFTPNGLPTSAEKVPTRISWSLVNGSHVTFKVDPGDGSGLRVLNDSKVSGAIFVGTLNITYEKAGVYNVSITACNKLENVTIYGLITIQETIANVSLNAPDCMATNKSVNLSASTEHGDMLKYAWTINNQTIKTNDQPWLIYTPSVAGISNITVVVYNNVSTGMYSCEYIKVQDTIEGVEIGPVQPSGVGQPLSIPYKVNHGSDFRISICYGDGVCTDKNGTENAEGIAVYNGLFTHNYTKHGDYLVNLTFCNCVGCNSSTHEVHVETPVSGQKMVVSRSVRPSSQDSPCSSPLYVQVNHTVFVVLSVVNGTNVNGTWEFGDGFTFTQSSLGHFDKNGMHSNHSYSKAGNYTITVKAYNLNGHELFTCHIVAQDPITGLSVKSDSPVGVPDGLVTMTTVPTGPPPSGPIYCVFRYGDNKISAALPMSFGHIQSVTSKHTYPSKGKFRGSANCSNEVSFFLEPFEVELQDKIGGSTIKSYGTVPENKRNWTAGDGYKGPHKQGTIFGRDTDIYFLTKSLNGSNLTCSFCFDCNGADKVIKNSSCHNITHRFSTSGEKEVRVEVKNDVSKESIKINLNINDNIDCGELVNDGPKTRGKSHIFTAAPKNGGKDWCCYIKYGDPSGPDYISPNSSHCLGLEFPATVWKFKGNTFHGNHTYPAINKYDVVMECGNSVSECKIQSKAVVSQIQCKQPTVSIMDCTANVTSITHMRSAEFDIRTDNKVDCEEPMKREFKWQIFNNTKTPNIPMNLTGIVDTSDKTLSIKSRTLKVGHYKVCFTLNMTQIIGVHGITCCNLHINATPVVAEVKGGTEVAVGFNKTRNLNGLNSRDPDTALTAIDDKNLRCYWFCKREGDNYTLPTSIDLSNLPAVPEPREIPSNNSHNMTDLGGCFGDGPGRLNSDSNCNLPVLTGKMQENTTYDFKLCVAHVDRGRTPMCTDQRWNVKQGDPPSMAIKCHINCKKERLNPSSKVSLQCYCDGCGAVSTQQLSTYWEISHLKRGSSEYVTLSKEEAEQLVATPIYGLSLAIEPDKLTGGEKYRFICKGKLGEKGTEGFAYYENVVNDKPKNGICDVRPRTGVALNTTFRITCSGWEDVHQPLLYTYGIVQECGKEMEEILAPDRPESLYDVDSMPPGPKDRNFTNYIVVHVSDHYKAVNTSTCLPIQVRENQLSTDQLGERVDTRMKALLASGSNNKVNQEVSAVLAQMSNEKDSESSSTEENKKQTELKEKLINVLDKVADFSSSLKDMTQTTKNLQEAVKDSSQLTQEAKKKSLSVTEKLTSNIEAKAKNAQPQELIQAVKAVVDCISNCMDFMAEPDPEPPAKPTEGAQPGDKEQPSTPKKMSEEEKNAKRQLTSSIIRTLEKIATLVINTKRPGEKPTIMKTDSVEIGLSRERTEDLKNKILNLKGFIIQLNQVPFTREYPAVDPKSPRSRRSVDQELENEKEQPAVDSKMLSSSKNIYNFDESANLVKGGRVVTLEFKNMSTREPMIVKDLANPIEMFVDRISSPESPVTSTMSTEGLYFLRMNVTLDDTAIHIHIYPNNCDYGFWVFIKRGSFPSERSYDYNYTLPHGGEWGIGSNCSKSSNQSSAFEIFLSNKDLNHTAAGIHYIGIKMKPRNGTKPQDILPANFTAVLYTSSCMYWNVKNESWRSDGCVVGPKTNPKTVQCLCTHLTSFSTNFIVPPNKIDWNKVKDFDISEAYVCLATVLVVIAFYIICLIPARRADRRDAEKTGVSPLPDNDPRDTYCYEIHVHTGFMRGAGTSAEISVVMNGSVGDSDPRVLKDPARKPFRTGGVDAFLMTVPQSLGSIRNIRIWHNNGGNYPSWNLLRVMVQDLQTEQRWWFVCDKWLAVDEGDGKIERIVYPATSNELTKFNVLFATEVRKNLTDGHLWFSVVTRPARSTFTRVQRLTCCLSILLCTMLANIMFYNADTSQGPKGSIKIAGFSFSLAQVSIGVISSLVVFPSNLIVVQLFRKARAKDTNITIASNEEPVPDEVDVEKGKEKEKPKKEGLPHWFVYVAYCLALGSSLASAVFVIFYGATYGEEKSAQWLMSMTISFIQDVLISQPIKVFLLASIFALLIKDPNKAESDPLTDANKLSTDEEWLHKNVKDLNDDEKESFKKLITDRPPDEAKLEIARQLRMKEKHMKSIIRELVWYMFFLLVVLTVSYGNRDPATYQVTKYVNDIFLHSRYHGKLSFDKVSKIRDYWKWLNETVVPSIYKDKWYNGHQSYPLGFLADTPTDLILAVARLRQLRIKKNSCSYLRIFHHVIPECNDFYSPEEEDRRDLLQGWKEPSSINMTSLPSKLPAKKTPWEYQTGEELKTFPYWGYKATYDAGGYVVLLPTNRKSNDATAHALVDDLHDNNWLDRYTRAIFTELSIYNANTNFFCVITLLYEQLPTGGFFNYPSILTLKLYRYIGGDMYFVLSCEIIYLIFTLYFIFRELKMVKKDGLGHFKNPWSMVEVLVTMLSLSLVVLYFVRMKYTSDSVKAMREDHAVFVSFHYTAFLDEWINAMMGLIVFLSFLKIIRLLRFNRRMSLLAQTLKVCLPRIFAFLLIYSVAFFAFSQFACLVFGQSMEGFGTILRSAATLMDTILGKFALKAITDANRLIGPTFFYFYTVTMVFILINMFLSIINDSFSEVKSDVNKQSNEYEIVNFMVHRLKENIGKTIGNAIMPVYKEPKSKLEKDVESIEEHADSIMHYMRNMTFENMRHTRWFNAETSKEKKKKMFKILLEVDWDYFEDELGDSIPIFEEFLKKYDEEKLEDVHQAYRYKKMREQQMESKFTTRESDLEDEESSANSNSDDSSSQSDGNNDDNPPIREYNLQHSAEDYSRQKKILTPGASVKMIYTPASAPGTPILLNSPRPLRSPAHTPELGKRSQANEGELSDVLNEVERKRCATDAELNSFLDEIKSIDGNNIPKYDSDPEQTTKKSKKKKKAKKLTPTQDKVSIKSKAAWEENASEVSRKSPAGYSDKDRIIPDGAEDSLNGQDNKGFEEDIPSSNKDQKRHRKKKKKNAQHLILSGNLEGDESMD